MKVRKQRLNRIILALKLLNPFLVYEKMYFNDVNMERVSTEQIIHWYYKYICNNGVRE